MVKPVSEEERRRHYTLTCRARDVEYIRALGKRIEPLNLLDREKVIKYVEELRARSMYRRASEELAAIKEIKEGKDDND